MPTKTDLLKSNPKLQYLQKRIDDTLMLAAEKVAGHLLNPQTYPLPPTSKKSLERALYDVAMALPKKKRDKFADKFKTSLNAGVTQRKQKYGDLHAIDLRSNKIIAEQVRDLPVSESMKITETEMNIISPKKAPVKIKLPGKKAGNKPQPQQAALATKLDFIVDNLVCNKTNDIRKDEINMGAFGNDSSGTVFDTAPFFVSKFKEGETVALGAKGNLFNFSIDAGSVGVVFPYTAVAGLFLVEADLIHNAELGEKLAAAFALIGLTLLVVSLVLFFVPGGAIYAIILLCVSGALNIFGHYIIPILIDDFSLVVTDTLVLEAQPAIGETFSRALKLEIEVSDFQFLRGEYIANARWVAS